MTVREETQTIERLTLSPYAALSEQSFGRRTPEPTIPECKPDKKRYFSSAYYIPVSLICK